jgi:hypothetical protein
MCPFCLSTIGLVAAAAVSTGGLAALAVRVSRKNGAGEIPLNSKERKNQDVDEPETAKIVSRDASNCSPRKRNSLASTTP